MGFEAHVVRFVYLLRALGIRVSTAETIDCLNGLTAISLLDRKQVRIAMGSTLIKSTDEYSLYQQAFDVYFANFYQRKKGYQEYLQEGEDLTKTLDQVDAQLEFLGDSLDLTDQEKYLYSQLTEEEQKNILDFIERSNQGKKIDQSFKPIIENIVRGSLDYWKRHLNREIKNLSEIDLMDEELNAYYQQVTTKQRQSKVIEEQDMQHIDAKEYTKVQLLIDRMTKRLANKLSRRHRQSKKGALIDIRKSIRASSQYGGALVNLKYEAKKRRQPKILLICDVSGSMAKYAIFVMQFIFGLSTATKKIESFIFAEKLERVTHIWLTGGGLTATMAEIMNNSQLWGKGTNLGESLDNLQQGYQSLLTKNTVVIVLSDGKTIDGPRATAELKGVHEKVREIIWLNTLAEEQWSKYKSIMDFKKYCSMYQCSTLKQLNKVVTKELSIS